MPRQQLVPPTGVPLIANHPLKTPVRLPPQPVMHTAVIQRTAVPGPKAANVTRTQLLQQLRNMRTLLGWRLRGRKAARPRTNAQLQARLVQLQHWFNRRSGPRV